MAKDFEKGLVPVIKEEELIIRESNVQVSRSKKRNSSQYFIHIPAPIVEELNIKQGDKFIFQLDVNNKQDYSIKLKRR